MISRRTRTITGSLLAASCSAAAVTIFACTAVADDGGGMSGTGGKAVDKAPAGVELTTALSRRISVDNGSQKTGITASVKNEGAKESGKIRLLVVGFEGLSVKNVKGCAEVPKNDLPKGSNSAFSCPVDNLASGSSASYHVDAVYDLTKQGKICLPVQSADGKKTYWQQGPVPFGTNNPSPNAPATPLLLGTDNSPIAPGGDQPRPGGGEPTPGRTGELPRTGPADRLLPFGAAGATLICAGAAGMWWSSRRPARRR